MGPECQKKENLAAEKMLGEQMWEEESVSMALTPPFRFDATDDGTSREIWHSSCTSWADTGPDRSRTEAGPDSSERRGPLPDWRCLGA